MLRKWMLALCFCLGIFGCGCAETTSDESSTASSEATTATTQSTDEKTTRDLFAMDTYITLTAYGNNAEAGISAAEACIQDLDARLSTGNTESEIAKLNATGSGTLSEDTSAILQEAITLYQDTDGAFNPLMYPIMQAWGFPTHEYRVPEDVSVIGFDGTALAEYYNPKLATIKQQYQTLATRSVEILFGQIELKRSQIHEIVPFELASGESIQKIR